MTTYSTRLLSLSAARAYTPRPTVSSINLPKQRDTEHTINNTKKRRLHVTINESWYLDEVEIDNATKHVSDLNANAGDHNGRGIALSITHNGQPVDTTGMSVYLAWGHEYGGEGLTEAVAIDSSKGKWRILYPTSMQRRGTVLARVMIYLNSSAITGSKNFRIFVDVDPVDGNTALSDNDFSVFLQAVVDLNTAKKNAEASTKAANDAAAKANSSASNADAATSAATSAASQAQGAASNASAAASTALQIANAVASNNAGDGDIAALKGNVDKLGNVVAELSGTYLVMDESLYTPTAKATASGDAATMKSSTVSGEQASLT
ncbi:MAG: BppU family phage baseplate upper protein [Gordonibacter sp.]|uniref:BppU family phage baseplate upper protein n=1 Tax=Gordonibacter sp. TaxID=1968902 RepID=UPI002FCBF2EA